MNEKQPAKKYLLFVDKNYVTDCVQTWDMSCVHSIKEIKNIVAKIQNIPNVQTVSIIHPEANHMNAKYEFLYSYMRSSLWQQKMFIQYIEDFRFFANISLSNYSHLQELSLIDSVSPLDRIKLQEHTLKKLNKNKKPTISVDGSLLPPYYCGWGSFSITGLLNIQTKKYDHNVSSNQPEIAAAIDASEIASIYNKPVIISTDCSFVEKSMRNDFQNIKSSLQRQINRNHIIENDVLVLSKISKNNLFEIEKTVSHKDDYANNCIDLHSRTAAKQLRNEDIKSCTDILSLKKNSNKTVFFHTGRFITDLWSIYSRNDIQNILLKHNPDNIFFVTDLKGDNQWLRKVIDSQHFFYYTNNDDKVFNQVRNNMFLLRDNNLNISSFMKKNHQKTILKLLAMQSNNLHYTTCIYASYKGTLICNGWFEDTLFKWVPHATLEEQQKYYQKLFDIAKYTDAKTSFVIQGSNYCLKSFNNNIKITSQNLTKSPKTKIRKPKKQEIDIFKLANLILKNYLE